MKKFLALVLVVAMLGLAGAAMAADSDTAGHGSPQPVTPDSTADRGTSSTPTIISVLVSRIARNVLVIGTSYANMPTFSSAVNVSGDNYNKANVARSISLGDLADMLGISQSQIETLFPMRSGDNLVQTTTSNYVSGDTAGNLQRVAGILKAKSGANNLRAVGLLVPFSAKANGIQAFLLDAFPAALAGYPVGIDMNSTGTTTSSSSAEFSASSTNGESDVLFIKQSDGLRTDVIPASTDRLIAIAPVTANTFYAPIVTALVSTASADAFNSATGTTTAAEVNVSVLEEATSTNGFSTAVADDVILAIQRAALGTSLDTIPAECVSADWTFSTTEDAYMTLNDLKEVVHMPSLSGLADKTYVAKVFFKNGLNLNYDNVTSPDFYPNGVVEGGNRTGTLYKISGTTTLTATPITTANAKTQIAANGVAYLVFRVANSAVAAFDVEAAAANLTKPSVVVSAWNNDGDPNPKGVGKASGGCAAGSAVLALAVLGSFIITRKK